MSQPTYKHDCRYFNGYKPCKFKRPCEDCPHYDAMGRRILIVNLDAFGDVVRTTALLPAIKRAYPQSYISWVTLPAARPILENNPYIDEVIAYDLSGIQGLLAQQFDLLLSVDKSRAGGGLAEQIQAKEKRGFGISPSGTIYPFNDAAAELYNLGLDDNLKFFVNQKNEQHLLAEAMQFEYQRDPYVLEFTESEGEFINKYRASVGIQDQHFVVGFNTGCSALYPYKKLPMRQQAELAQHIVSHTPDVKVVLLGGREDTQRNKEIAELAGDAVIQTPTDHGLRKGILYTDLADTVISGDSLGMHIAIGLKKQVIAWFGVTCPQEIDLYERGVKLVAKVDCNPCWQRSCDKETKCYNMVDSQEILTALDAIYDQWKTARPAH